MPYPIISLYGPSKTFLWYYRRALRTELKSQGLQVCCRLPGATATPPLYDGQGVNVSLARQLGIMGEAEAVARAGLRALFAGRAKSIPGSAKQAGRVCLARIARSAGAMDVSPVEDRELSGDRHGQTGFETSPSTCLQRGAGIEN